MPDRPPAEEITRGLETTSAKIRALAQAGYDRTEIAEHLDIRYQHVRKVLLDAGITSGLRRQVQAEREPVTVDAEPAPRKVDLSPKQGRCTHGKVQRACGKAPMLIRANLFVAIVLARPGI